MGLEGREFVQRHVQHQGLRVDYFQEIGVARSGGHHFWPVRQPTGGVHLLHRLQGERTSGAHPGTANSSPGPAPVLHWSRRRVQRPLLYGRVVRRERVQLQCLRWELVRGLFADASCTNTCGESKSYTSSSGTSSSSRPKSVLLHSGLHRQLRYRWMVRWERGQLCWLRGRLVQFSSTARAQLHDEASEGPHSMIQHCWLALQSAGQACAWWVASIAVAFGAAGSPVQVQKSRLFCLLFRFRECFSL